MKKQLLSLAVASLVCTGIAQARFYIGVEGGYTGGARDTKSSNYDTQTNSSYFLIPSSGTLSNVFKDTTTYYNNGKKEESKPWEGYNLAINFGSEHFFASNYLGVRWGASVGYTAISQDCKLYDAKNSTDYTDHRDYLDAGLSLDLMVNLVNSSNFSFGIFGGVEGAYHYLISYDRETSTGIFSTTLTSLVTPSRNSLDFSGRVGVSTLLAKHHRIDVTAKLPIGYVVAGDDNKTKIAHDVVKMSFNLGYKYVF